MNAMHERFEGLKTATLHKVRMMGGSWADRGELDDLKQESLLCAWQHFLALLADGKDPERLRWQTAHWSVLQAMRRLAHRPVKTVNPANLSRGPRARPVSGPVDLGELLPGDSGPVAEVVGARVDSALWAQSLSPRERAVVELLAAGFDLGQVGARLGLSKATVHCYKVRAREKWARMMDCDD